MEHRALAALIIRITGLIVIVSAITYTGRSFGPFFVADTAQELSADLVLASIVISLGVPVVLGLLLVYFPSTVTTRVLRIEGLNAENEEDTKAIERVAFAAIGLWLTLYAVIDTVYIYAKVRLFYRFLEDMPAYTKPPPMLADDLGGLVASAVQLLIGLWLLIGNRGIVNVLARLRG
jgi:hypothetical protein